MRRARRAAHDLASCLRSMAILRSRPGLKTAAMRAYCSLMAMRRLRNTILIGLIAGFFSQTLAQTDPCLDRAIPVGVYTADGHSVLGLTAENFQASLGGQRARVAGAAYDAGPRRIVILVDRSSSMHTGDRLSLALAVAQAFVGSCQAQDSFAVVDFAATAECAVPFGLSRDAVMAGIGRRIHARLPMGTTALFDAVGRGLDLLAPAHVGDAIYLLTDGGDNASHISESEAEREVNGAGVRIYAVWMVDSVARARAPDEVSGEQVVDTLVRKTGGEYVTLPPLTFQARWISKGEFDASNVPRYERGVVALASRGLAERIHQFYRLEILLSSRLNKPANLKLRVVDASGHPHRHLSLTYPERLEACEAPTSN